MSRKKKILIVSHDKAVRVFTAQILRSHADYNIFTVKDETKVIERALQKSPDLIILDVMIPRIDGYYVYRMLRSGAKPMIPIIMLAHHKRTTLVNETETNDTSAPPFDPMAFLARVEDVLYRQSPSDEINPFIYLSGHLNLGQILSHYPQFAVGYADLDNFAGFNAYYGFTKGDQVIGSTKQIIQQALSTFGTQHDLVKHVDGDDFVFITGQEKVEYICHQIVDTFDQEIQAKYAQPLQYYKQYYKHFSPISISIAVATNFHEDFADFSELGEIAMELRKYLKTLPGSNYYIDRRSKQ